MPNTRQAEKRMRRDAKRRLRNRYHLSRMRTYIKKFRKMIENNQIEEAKEFLPKVISIIYHTASKGVIHKREAASFLTRLLSRCKTERAKGSFKRSKEIQYISEAKGIA